MKPQKPLTPMAIDQTLRGKYAESAMNGILSSGHYGDKDARCILIKESFEIADKMIEEEFKKRT